MTAKYPDDFYVAHALFRGPQVPAGGVWGDILDGPENDPAAVIEAVAEHFPDPSDPPTADTLRVWHVAGGQVRDALPRAILAWERSHPEVCA